jgi:fucose 4-O-acetylase-like acetyltransferase
MGATAVLLALLAIPRGLGRVRLAAGAGVAIAALSPLMSALQNNTAIPAPFRDYIVPSVSSFSVFPWGAYLAFGLAAGSALPLVRPGAWGRVMQWSALAGIVLLVAGQYSSSLTLSMYPLWDYWLNSPELVAGKLGAALVLAAAAFLWTEYFSTGWSWVRQLGTTSLAVYWVHTELVYGFWLGQYHERVSVGWCVSASLALIALMVVMSVAIKRVPWRRLLRFQPDPVPVSGD